MYKIELSHNFVSTKEKSFTLSTINFQLLIVLYWILIASTRLNCNFLILRGLVINPPEYKVLENS